MGSNTAFGENIEIDYGLGISPKWRDFTFTIGGLEYTYPGANSEIAYFELKTGATWPGCDRGALASTIIGRRIISNFLANLMRSRDRFGYTFAGKLFNFFTPGVSGTFGFQSYEQNADDYTYWNAGLTLTFLDHWSADIRYYDTDYNQDQCLAQSGGRDNCDARAVGTIKATF